MSGFRSQDCLLKISYFPLYFGQMDPPPSELLNLWLLSSSCINTSGWWLVCPWLISSSSLAASAMASTCSNLMNSTIQSAKKFGGSEKFQMILQFAVPKFFLPTDSMQCLLFLFLQISNGGLSYRLIQVEVGWPSNDKFSSWTAHELIKHGGSR